MYVFTYLGRPGTDPTIVSYNASSVKMYNVGAVKIYNATSSLVRFGKKIFSFALTL
jgi:hypothetical protein